MKSVFIKLAVVFFASIALLSCSKGGGDNLNPLLKYSKNIISTRPQNKDQIIAILKLQTPSVFENATVENGKAVADKKLVEAIAKEQEAALAELKKLSADVQLIYSYKMVLNAIAILAPASLEGELKNIGLVAYAEGSGNFERPSIVSLSNSVKAPVFAERNSAKFIGAVKLNEKGITGKGVKVGIIDTGIDYTHAMFGGEGTEEAYKAVNPDITSTAFPNKKVVGGIDLVGTKYNSGSPDFEGHLPKPDMNPLDEAGHGTHVAGTVAGIGDGVNTYNGMAPDAELYAIKVFGADGSTSDFVVIAALEYAADPNADGDNSDQLDVVNLSLGSSYGNPKILYNEAVKNLVYGGTSVVASAGNSGHKDYIVGSPGTSDDALSVAASVDNGDHLWRFNASRVSIGNGKILVQAIEAATTKKIADAGEVSGKLVHIGLANKDLTDDQKAALKGNIAFIDRGQVNFNDKIKRAVSGGAIGVVVANNSEGSAFVMGTSDKFEIPAIMITLQVGNEIKEALKNQEVFFDFKTDEKIEMPQLIDTLTDFTSKGPRSTDGFIKPEISAPGENVISADMGGGNKAVQMSGTSMAAPHMSGVMALLKQAHPDFTAQDLKALAMGTTKTVNDEESKRYAISEQGAGRVQADKAVESKILIQPAALSLGQVGIETKKTVRKQLVVKNISDEKQTLDVMFEGNGFITMTELPSLVVEPKSSLNVSVQLTLDAVAMQDEKIREMDGWIKLTQRNGDRSEEVYRVPVLAVAHKLSSVEANNLIVKSSSDLDSAGAAAELTLVNNNVNSGEALLFNLIGQDSRKPIGSNFMATDCDLQMAGYRFVTRKNKKNQNEDILQVAVKLYKPVTTWHACDISVLIDGNSDGVVDQELLGSHIRSVPGLTQGDFATTLLDANKAREIRKEYEEAIEQKKNGKLPADTEIEEDYSDAVLEQQNLEIYENSTVAILEVSTKNLMLTREGALSFKVVVTHNEQSTVELDDYLQSTVETDMKISLNKNDQAFLDLPEVVKIAGEKQTVQLTKGEGTGSLLVLYPNNRFTLSDLHSDSQSQVLSPVYKIK